MSLNLHPYSASWLMFRPLPARSQYSVLIRVRGPLSSLGVLENFFPVKDRPYLDTAVRACSIVHSRSMGTAPVHNIPSVVPFAPQQSVHTQSPNPLFSVLCVQCCTAMKAPTLTLRPKRTPLKWLQARRTCLQRRPRPHPTPVLCPGACVCPCAGADAVPLCVCVSDHPPKESSRAKP